jgi:hypothetical protein
MRKPHLPTEIGGPLPDRFEDRANITEGNTDASGNPTLGVGLHSRFNPSRVGFGIADTTKDAKEGYARRGEVANHRHATKVQEDK